MQQKYSSGNDIAERDSSRDQPGNEFAAGNGDFIVRSDYHDPVATYGRATGFY
jgi:hypothetical protein